MTSNQTAWYDLRRNRSFWFASTILLTLITMSTFPFLFTNIDPTKCSLNLRFHGPEPQAPFGYDLQGCNIYARAIYGTRPSMEVGIVATTITGAISLTLGMASGFYGRIIDALLSRIIDIAASIPLLLIAIVLLKRINHVDSGTGVMPVAFTLGLLSWPMATRVVRSSVIEAKQQGYVQAARILGASNIRIMVRHILPHVIAPVAVVLAITLGTVIAAEATLSFLGIGLHSPTISWGGSINDNSGYIRTHTAALLWPAAFLMITVLAFVMLADAVRDAFNPRSR